MVAKTLIDRREMLNEYFSLEISEAGDLLSIPLLLKGYVPSLAKLPRFLLRLGPYVNWKTEEECFRTFLRELAAFYTPEQLPPPPSARRRRSKTRTAPTAAQSAEAEAEAEDKKEEEEEEKEDESITTRRAQLTRMLEHVIFPALRSRLVATTSLLRGVVEVADLKGLYRVFERC